MIILISGHQGSGKSTLTNELLKHFGPVGAIKLRFAQPLYEMHDIIRNILAKYHVTNYNYTTKDGYLLQALGEWGRAHISKDVWTHCVLNQVMENPKNLVQIIEDARFEHEVDPFMKLPNCLTVRLECPESIRKQRAEMWRENTDHPSETGLDKYAKDGKFDLYFRTDSTSTEEIAECIEVAISQLRSTLYGARSDQPFESRPK